MFSGLYSNYPTFSVFLAVFIACVLTILVMPAWIKFLKREKVGQQVRDDGPETHLVKQGTPTMGGVIMLLAVVVTIILVAKPQAEMISLLVATLLAGLLGFIDDFSKVKKSQSLGLTPKAKLVGQFLVASAFVLFAVNALGVAPTVELPFICTINMGVWTTVIGGVSVPWIYLVFVDILLVGMCNAVNLTDGLDGLASGTVMVVMVVLAAIAYASDMLPSAVFAAALAGACIGFLWSNAYPADVFMGDTGSLALGMALGCLAVVTKTEITSIIIGGLFVAEALSVMIQVFYYKKTQRRVFLMAPLHHHYEKKGWSETKVVIRFCIVSGAFAAIGFVIFFASHMGGVM